VSASADAQYLEELSNLAGSSFASTEEAVSALLELLSEQLGVRSSFISQITLEQERFQVLAAHNEPGGCDVPPGARLELPQTL
jgi:hypothetical protein